MRYLWVIIGILVFTACSAPDEQDQEGQMEQAEAGELVLSQVQLANIDYSSAKAEYRPLNNSLKLNGYLAVPPHGEALVTSLVEAQVTSIMARPFHSIKRGEALFRLEGQSILDLQQDYLERRSQLKFTEREFGRKETLHESGHLSDMDYELAERDLLQLKAVLAGLEQKLRLLDINPVDLTTDDMKSGVIIRSPIAGTVEDIRTRIGEYVHPGDPLIRIVNADEMHLELQVFEKDLDRIKVGEKVNYWLLDKSSVHMEASIENISNEVDPATRMVTVHAHIDSKRKGSLKPGNYVEARLVVNSDSTICLPSEALVKDQGLTYIFRVRKHPDGGIEFDKINVVPTVSDGGYTGFKLADEIDPDDEFVVGGAYFVMAQSRILEGRAGE